MLISGSLLWCLKGVVGDKFEGRVSICDVTPGFNSAVVELSVALSRTKPEDCLVTLCSAEQWSFILFTSPFFCFGAGIGPSGVCHHHIQLLPPRSWMHNEVHFQPPRTTLLLHFLDRAHQHHCRCDSSGPWSVSTTRQKPVGRSMLRYTAASSTPKSSMVVNYKHLISVILRFFNIPLPECSWKSHIFKSWRKPESVLFILTHIHFLFIHVGLMLAGSGRASSVYTSFFSKYLCIIANSDDSICC